MAASLPELCLALYVFLAVLGSAEASGLARPLTFGRFLQHNLSA